MLTRPYKVRYHVRIMKPCNGRLEVRINRDTKKKLLMICEKEHLKLSTLVRIIIEKFVTK